MKAIVLINKNCQFLRKNDYFTEKYLSDLLQKHHISGQILFLTPADIISKVQQIITEKNAVSILVGGGDGTVSSVANLLVGSTIPLGILPLGTLNHFAKDINLPTDIEACLEIFKKALCKKVDVANLNGKFFINNVSIGFYPHLVHDRDKKMRGYKLGKFFSMFLSALNIFHRFPLYHIKLITGIHQLDFYTPLIFIGNNEYDTSLFSVKSRTQIDNNELCIYAINSNTRLQFLKLLLFAATRLLDQSRDFIKVRTKEAKLIAWKDKIRVAIDGETIVTNNPLEFRIEPKHLTVIVPTSDAIKKQF